MLDQFPAEGLDAGPLDPQALSWLTVTRALKTFDALLHLADAGYGEQATMLARAVFEDMVVAWWCARRKPTDLLDLMVSHEQSVAIRLQRKLPGPNLLEARRGAPQLSDLDLARIQADSSVDPRRATRHWTGTSIAAQVDEIAADLPERERKKLDFLFDMCYLLSSLSVHHSPASLSATISSSIATERGPDSAVVSRKPSRTLVHDALVIGYQSLALLARLVTQADNVEVLNLMLADDRPILIVLDEDQLRVGRNESCPCASGHKFKNCHGLSH